MLLFCYYKSLSSFIGRGAGRRGGSCGLLEAESWDEGRIGSSMEVGVSEAEGEGGDGRLRQLRALLDRRWEGRERFIPRTANGHDLKEDDRVWMQPHPRSSVSRHMY